MLFLNKKPYSLVSWWNKLLKRPYEQKIQPPGGTPEITPTKIFIFLFLLVKTEFQKKSPLKNIQLR